MSPTVFRDGEFRFFFFSREESRLHIHVSHPDGEAKFWLNPTIELARNIGLSSSKVKEAERLVKSRQQEIIDAWNTPIQVSMQRFGAGGVMATNTVFFGEQIFGNGLFSQIHF